MRTVTKENITRVFMSFFGEDADLRLLETMQCSAFHLRAFAKELELSHKELGNGIEFIERADSMPGDERCEYIPHFDVNGFSSHVDTGCRAGHLLFPRFPSRWFRRAIWILDRQARHLHGTDGRQIEEILHATDRHPWRSSRPHNFLKAEGYRPLATETFSDDVSNF